MIIKYQLLVFLVLEITRSACSHSQRITSGSAAANTQIQKLLLQGIIGINSLIKQCKSQFTVFPRCFHRFGPVTGSESRPNEQKAARVEVHVKTDLPHRPYLHLQKQLAEHSRTLLLLDHQWRQTISVWLGPGSRAQTVLRGFTLAFGRTSGKQQRPEWPTPSE